MSNYRIDIRGRLEREVRYDSCYYRKLCAEFRSAHGVRYEYPQQPGGRCALV